MSTTQDLETLYAQLNAKEETLAAKLSEKESKLAQQQDVLPKLYDQLYDSLFFYLLKPYSLPSGTSQDALLLREFKLVAERLLQAAQGTSWEDDVILYFVSEDTTSASVVQQSKRLQLLQIIDGFANVVRGDRKMGELDNVLSSSTGSSIAERLMAWATDLWNLFGALPLGHPFTNEVSNSIHILEKLVKRLTLRDTTVNLYFHRLLDHFNSLKTSLLTVENAIISLEQEIAVLQADINAILFEGITSSLPLLLFPLRVETKFVEQVGSNYPYHLLVRVFPDDIAIQAHEQEMELTQEEVADGTTFWGSAPQHADGTQDYLSGWKQLVEKYESPRAAWIVRQTNPHSVAVATGTKPGNWVEAAYSYVMPEQFFVNLYENYSPEASPSLHKYGKPVNYPLQVGINPKYLDDSPEDGPDTAHLDPGMKWLTDFDEAEKVGMGIRIGLTLSQFNNGFERLVVAGLKLGQADGKGLLQRLFETHHYTNGIKIIPQGTATNNTNSQKAGYSEQDWLDVESTFNTELGAPQYAVDALSGNKADGLLLAEALGIGKATFQHVAHANGQDVQEAVLMNKCLWNATLGYYFEEMLRPNFSLTDLDDLRGFFTEHVVGRGQLPAFSIGNQPYGVMLTTSFSQWSDPVGSPAFDTGLHAVLNALTEQWKAAAGNATGETETIEALLEKLGLEASSTEYYQRYGFGPVMSRSYLNDELNAAIGTPTALYNKLKNEAGLNFTSIPKVLESTFQADYGKIAETFSDTAFTGSYGLGYLIDSKPFSETEPVENLSGLEINYIDWLISSQFHQVRLEDFAHLYQGSVLPPTFEKPNSMLYYMLRHSLLLSYWDTAMRILVKNGSLPASKREEAELFGVLGATSESPRWAVLDMLIAGVPAWQYLKNNAFTGSNQFYADMAPLREVLQALPALATLPTARLERLFAEHLDLCSYRLDAWKIGQAYSRLKKLRQTQAEGIHLGAFGWLENVGRAGQDVADYSQAPRTDAANKGFIHAPSLNHATAAAILRQGYKSQQDAGAGDFAVDLSSHRVRYALDLLEGVREGQTINALLGYQFERELHEMGLDAYIYLMRDTFPLVVSSDASTNAGDPALMETLGARNVVDGLKLMDRLKAENSVTTYLQSIGVVSIEHAVAVYDIYIALVKTMDALSDLMVAEGVYQTTLGKIDHASASLDNLSNGKLPPMPEIVQSPRREIPLTQRVMLSLPAEDAVLGSSQPTSFWWSKPSTTDLTTPMALAEPKLNAWLRKMLSCLTDVNLEVSVSTEAGNVILETVSLNALQLQPIDWVYMLNESSMNEGSFLYALVKHYLVSQRSISTGAVIKINFENAVQGLSVIEVMPLITRLHSLITNSRAGNATDLQLGGFDDVNPEGYNIAELKGRIESAANKLLSLQDELVSRIAAAGTTGAAASIRNILLRISFFNVPDAASALLLGDEELITAAQLIAEHVYGKFQKADQLLKSSGIAYSGYVEASQSILGKGFRVVPLFELTALNKPLLEEGMLNSDSMLPADQSPVLVMEEWLQGIARVKDRMDMVEKVTTLHEILNSFSGTFSELSIKPVQLPLQKDENNVYADKWVGIEMPEGYSPNADKLSIVFLDADNFNANVNMAGLLVDEWVEAIPERDVTTAVSFHYDQPQSQPPQTLLLAVPPVIGTNDSWNIGRMLGCINETLDLAKLRAVDTDQLADGSALAQLLPALVAPVSATNATIALDFAKTIHAPVFAEQTLM